MTSDNPPHNPDYKRKQPLNDQPTSGVEPSRQDIQELVGLCNSGQMSNAESRSKELLEKHRNSAVLYNILGSSLCSQGKFDEAVSSYEQALRIEPNHSQVLSNLGITLMRLGKRDEALKILRQAVEVDPRNAYAHGNLGNALMRLGKQDEAVAILRQAVEIDPRNAHAYGDLGYALVLQGKVEEGVDYYQQALKINPDIDHVHNKLGNALKQLGKLDEAMSSYYQALKLKPDAMTYFNLHSLLIDSDNMSPAIQCQEAAVKLQPRDIGYKFFLGMLLEYSGRAESADAYFKEIQQGSNLDKARLDAWNYIKSAGTKMPKMIGSAIEAFRLGMDAAPRSGLVLEFGVRFGVSIRQIAGLAKQQVYGFDSFEADISVPRYLHHLDHLSRPLL